MKDSTPKEKKTVKKRKKVIKRAGPPTIKHYTAFDSPSHEMSIEEQYNIAHTIYKHVRKKNIYSIHSLQGDLDIDERTYYRWIDKYPIINQAHEKAKAYLSGKRFEHAVTKKISEKALNYVAQYSTSFREFEEWRASLNKRDESKAGNVTVVLESLTQDTKRQEPDNQIEETE